MSGGDVHAVLSVDYRGTTVTKAVTIKANGDTDAVNVNRAIEHLTKKIQMMVQSEQGVQ
jgi:hypothetical protein